MALIARDTCARNPCAGLCIRARTLVGPGQEFLEDTCDGRLCVSHSLVSGLSEVFEMLALASCSGRIQDRRGIHQYFEGR